MNILSEKHSKLYSLSIKNCTISHSSSLKIDFTCTPQKTFLSVNFNSIRPVHTPNYVPFCHCQESVIVPGRVVGRRARALHLLQGAGLPARPDAAGLCQVGGVVVQVSGLAER